MSKKPVEPTMHTPLHSPSDVGVTLPPEIQKHLGNLLKASYNDVLTAPIPDRFVKLLEQLDQLDIDLPAATPDKDKA